MYARQCKTQGNTSEIATINDKLIGQIQYFSFYYLNNQIIMIVSIVLNRVLHESLFFQHDLNPPAIANIKHGIILDMELSRSMTEMTHPSDLTSPPFK